MKTRSNPLGAALSLALLAGAASAADTEDSLKPFLAEIAPGPQSAHEMLGLAPSAVTNLQSPQDWLGVIGAANNGNGDAGFGLAFTPARSTIRGLAVSARNYAHADKWLHRLWGATTLSYARNRAEYGAADYRQQAFFVQTTYYLKSDDDPVVAAYRGVANCIEGKAKAAEFGSAQVRQFEAEKARLGRALSDAEIDALEARMKQEFESDMSKAENLLALANQATRDCAQRSLDAATAKWNARRVGLTIGQGWVRGTAAGAGKHSLGRHFTLAVASALPGFEKTSLVNLTVRRTSREVDTATLAGTPAFKAASAAALRFTYDAGSAPHSVYALAEVSNAKNNGGTQSSTAFKQALGLDYRVREGMWLEFRVGRARDIEDGALKTRSLLNLKFVPEAGLPQLFGS